MRWNRESVTFRIQQGVARILTRFRVGDGTELFDASSFTKMTIRERCLLGFLAVHFPLETPKFKSFTAEGAENIRRGRGKMPRQKRRQREDPAALIDLVAWCYCRGLKPLMPASVFEHFPVGSTRTTPSSSVQKPRTPVTLSVIGLAWAVKPMLTLLTCVPAPVMII